MPAALAAEPSRVVSMNLCTDQLAMLLAAEGQLLSVSHIALDPNVSAMSDAARTYRINSGRAEEIYLMQPDLVLAGSHTSPAALDMLRGLGIRVEVFDAAVSLDGVRDAVERMGDVLHREDAAADMLAAFDARRAALAAEGGARPRAMLYYANGFTSGAGSLAHEILELAGFRNAAVEAGYDWGMKMPLEVLAVSDPDVVITSVPYPGGSRAEDVMRHPALRALTGRRAAAALSDHDWVCGTPFVLRAAERLAALRRSMRDVTAESGG
jgi:iron complex transport system substrate-binding protein